MEKATFIQFYENEFSKYGFIKHKKGYFLNGEKEVLCGISLQKSGYGNAYYINYFFCLGDFSNEKDYPLLYDSDIQGRITVLSKTQTVNGKPFLTPMIEYKEYTEDELRASFDKEIEEKILPPIVQGRKYIFDNIDKLYFLTLNKEDVLNKLQQNVL